MAKRPTEPRRTPTPTPVAPEPKQTPESESKVDSRFALPLDKDGKLLIETMRENSRAKLRELFTDPSIAKALNISPDESPAMTLSLPPVLLLPLVNALSIFETLIIARVTKAPRELVEKIAPYSREEAQQIAPALGAVLSKYGSTFLTKYGEETALLAMLSMMTMNKISVIRDEMERTSGPRGVVVPIVPADRHEPEPPATEGA